MSIPGELFGSIKDPKGNKKLLVGLGIRMRLQLLEPDPEEDVDLGKVRSVFVIHCLMSFSRKREQNLAPCWSSLAISGERRRSITNWTRPRISVRRS